MEFATPQPAPPPLQGPTFASQQILAGNGSPALEGIMQWVGPRRWLYVAGVSTRFCSAYSAAHSAGAARSTHYAVAAAAVTTLLFAAAALEPQLRHSEEQRRAVLAAVARAVVAHCSPAVAECAVGPWVGCEGADVLVPVAAALRPGIVAAVCKRMGYTALGVADELAMAEAALAAARNGDDGRCLTALTLARKPHWDGASLAWPAWFNSTICAAAAGEGHLHTVRWCFEHGNSAAFGRVTPGSSPYHYEREFEEGGPWYAHFRWYVPLWYPNPNGVN